MLLPASGPLQVAPQCWSVGHRNPESLLQCNTYVRTFESGSRREHLVIDPGSRLDYSVVERNVRTLVGDLSELAGFTLNHQDPDVVGNAPAFCVANPRLKAFVTEDVWRLVRHLKFQPGAMEFVNASRSHRGFDGRLQLVATPFCHFRGAMAFYDPELRTLFSGDLFGGLNQLGRVHLFAEDSDWVGVAQFHQIYMPSRDILRYAIRQIRALRPAVEIIAPQHGHLIAGEQVPAFLDRMHELLVGHDLLDMELDEHYLDQYQAVISDFIGLVGGVIGLDDTFARLCDQTIHDGLQQQLQVRGRNVRLLKDGYSALSKTFGRIVAGEPSLFANTLRSVVFALCSKRGIPLPSIGTGIEDGDAGNER